MEKIIIAGAGLVGSLLALLLKKRGYEVHVYERRSDMRNEELDAGRSINLALSTRGWKALELAGIKSEIEAIGLPMFGRMMHDIEGDLTAQAYGQQGQAIYSVSRAELNIQLMNEAEKAGVLFHFNQKVTKVDFKATTLHLFDYENKIDHQINADWIIGADGAFSKVRASMQKRGRFNYSQFYLDHGYKELTIPATKDGEFAMDNKSLHIWPRGEFMLIALPNLDKSFTCTLFFPYEGEVSFDSLNNEEKVIAFFKEYFPDTIDLMPTLTQDFFENPTGSLVTIKCNPWQNNNSLIIGDASHAIVPFYGQGMNSGFEDCSILIELLDKHEDLGKAIEKFSDNRPKDADAIAELAFQNFVEMRDRVADESFLLRKKVEKALHKYFPEEFLPVYETVTFSHVPYSKALEKSTQHEQVFKNILTIPDLQSKLDDLEFLKSLLRSFDE